MLRVVQIQNGDRRCVAVVDEPHLRIVRSFESLYAIASEAIKTRAKLTDLIRKNLGDESLTYDAVYDGNADWKLMVPFDHSRHPASTLVSGTGLTHFGSARDRQSMHAKTTAADVENLTDSMKMFQWGVEGGRPEPGKIGAAPEWFYKGNATILRAHGQSLDIPDYAEDGGEEAEIVGIYLIGPDGLPCRVGLATGNEFSDHLFEKRNYLNLAGSKLRTCSLGPELLIDPAFDSVCGEARIERAGTILWRKAVKTGETEMCHSLRNIEHHHFKFAPHRQAGDVHIHYFGAHSLSFGDGIRLLDGDVMGVRWEGYGRELRNPVRIHPRPTEPLISAIPL